jgi:hypothetical protein
MERDYRQDVKIDPEQLDVMWLNQAALYSYYAEASARARDKRDRSKQARDVKRAEVDKDVRTNPSKYGVEKVTVDSVISAVESSQEYKQAVETYQEDCLAADLSQVAVNGMEQRKSALENLVRLHAASYFAGPREPRDLTAAQAAYEGSQHAEKIKETTRGMARQRLNQ